MKANQHVAIEAVCPFYHKNDATAIYCEGCCEWSASSRESFLNKMVRKAFMKTHCCSITGWKQCRKAKGLMSEEAE